MVERLIERLLWDKKLTPRMQHIWAVLILLAPLALAAGLWLQWTNAAAVPARVTTDRARLIEKAHAFGNTLRLETRGWEELVTIVSNPEDSASAELYRYLMQQGERGKRLLVEHGLWSRVLVRLEEPGGAQVIEVWFTPTGEQTGYRVKLSSHSDPAESVSEEEAFRIAQQRLAAMLQSRPWLQAKDQSRARSDDDKAHVFRWNVVSPEFSEIAGEAVVRVLGRNPTQETVNVHLAEAARPSFKEQLNRERSRGLFSPYIVFLTVYCWMRYFKRRAQREVSRQRMLIVMLLIGAFMFSQVYLEARDFMKFSTDVFSVPAYVYLLISALLGLLAGLTAGLAYSSAEGDLREIDPRRLTSLDALLSGRIFSRNVGRSIVLGTVLLGWMLLVWNLVYTAGRSNYPGMESFFNSYGMVFALSPLLSMTMNAISAAIFLPLISLFAPASFIWRKIRRPRLALALIAVAAWLPAIAFSREPFGLPMRMLLSAIEAAGFLTAFLFADVLTSIVLCALFVFASHLVALAQTAPVVSDDVLWSLVIAGGTIAGAVVCCFAGRVVDEASVRPAYAREIHERQQLESEVEAAREAQQRLLPGAPPAVPGLTVAASCQAAESVSGDFYDFFLISRDRLGILISDGGGNGLATALMIAFAKGFLMEKAEAGWGAIQTLRALEATMREHLHGLHTEGLFYAVLDVQEGTFRFARIGESPGVLLTGTMEAVHEIRHQDGAVAMWEGFARIAPSTRIVIYTNGVCRLVGEPDCAATNRWLQRRLKDSARQTAASLHDGILKAVFAKRLIPGKRVAEEDVTILVAGIDRVEAAAVEHVA